jgi:hypothetical protein
MKSVRHFCESGRKRWPPANQHIIMAGRHRALCRRKPHRLTKTAANPVAFDSAAGLPRHGKTDAGEALISPIPRLENERTVGGSHAAAGSGPKITAASQPLDDDGGAAPIRH